MERLIATNSLNLFPFVAPLSPPLLSHLLSSVFITIFFFITYLQKQHPKQTCRNSHVVYSLNAACSSDRIQINHYGCNQRTFCTIYHYYMSNFLQPLNSKLKLPYIICQTQLVWFQAKSTCVFLQNHFKRELL